jgi:uncharacterized membrane protein YdbT with pleckstrin-like domain
MDLRPGEVEIYNGHPSWRSTLLFYLGGLVIAIAAGVIGYAASGAGVGAGVAGGIFVIVLIVGWLRRITTRYTISNHRIYVRRGILSRNIDQTRIERLQDVSTSQSFFDRILGIGTVDFDTAGGERHEDLFQFEGVASPNDIVRQVDDAIHAAQQAAPAATGQPVPPGGDAV